MRKFICLIILVLFCLCGCSEPQSDTRYNYEPPVKFDGLAIYKIQNSGSGKYLEFLAAEDGANIYQYDGGMTDTQAFRIIYDGERSSMTVQAATDTDGGTAVLSYGKAAKGSKGYSNVSLSYDDGERSMETEWIIVPQGQPDTYKICLADRQNIVLTACGSGNGGESGRTRHSEGNVYVTEFAGASEQLWHISSGGTRVLANSVDITRLPEDHTYELPEEAVSLSFNCPVTDYTDRVSWSNGGSQSFTVDWCGRVTAHKAGGGSLVATVTHADDTVTTYLCRIYVVLEDGVYSFNSVSSGFLMRHVTTNEYGENSPLEVYDNEGSESLQRQDIFKVSYLGHGFYGVRSMLDNSLGWTYTEDALVIDKVGTDTDKVPDSSKWIIGSNADGYYIKPYTASGDCIISNGNRGIGFAKYNSSKEAQAWNISEVTEEHYGISIKKKKEQVGVGELSLFEEAVFSSAPDSHGGMDVTWSVQSISGEATVDPSTGVLKGISEGIVTVKATYTPSTSRSWVASLTVEIIPIAEGTYYFQSSDGRLVMQAAPDTGELVLSQTSEGEGKRLRLEYIPSGDCKGYYNIIDEGSGEFLTAPSEAGGRITLRERSVNACQLWKVISVGDGTYRLAPRSMSPYGISAVGDGGDGMQVVLQLEGDAWRLVEYGDIRCIGIPDDAHLGCDHNEVFYDIKAKLEIQGDRQLDIYECADTESMLAMLRTSSIVTVHAHGTQELIYLGGSELTVSMINALPDGSLDGLELLLLISCQTGKGGADAENLVNALHAKGVGVVVGFENTVYCNQLQVWTRVLFESLCDGNTVAHAISDANDVTEEQFLDIYKVTPKCYAAGNTDIVLMDREQ